MRCDVHLPPHWVRTKDLDIALAASQSPHDPHFSSVFFYVPSQCKLMVDATIRLLSLLNQLCYRGKSVVITFEDGLKGTMGYLDRMGFFDHLSSSAIVFPKRDESFTVAPRRGQSTELVEIKKSTLDTKNAHMNQQKLVMVVWWGQNRDISTDNLAGGIAVNIFRAPVPGGNGNIQRLADNRIVRGGHQFISRGK
jgi:hypothetical protein